MIQPQGRTMSPDAPNPSAGATAAGKDAFSFSEEQWQNVDAIVDRHRGRPGALIPVLEEVQGVTGFLPEPVLRRVARGLGVPLSQVYGVVTFYSFFTMRPRGRHTVRVCLGTACHVARATDVLAAFQERLGCEPGELSEDGAVGLEIVRCVGACGLAPVVQIDDTVHGQTRSGEVVEILRRCRCDNGAAADVATAETPASPTAVATTPAATD